jgi:hypothetical protein
MYRTKKLCFHGIGNQRAEIIQRFFVDGDVHVPAILFCDKQAGIEQHFEMMRNGWLRETRNLFRFAARNAPAPRNFIEDPEPGLISEGFRDLHNIVVREFHLHISKNFDIWNTVLNAMVPVSIAPLPARRS